MRPPSELEGVNALEAAVLALKVETGPVVNGIVWVVTSVRVTEELR